MVLGMSLATFTLLHVIISLIAIVAGLVVMFGMLGSQAGAGPDRDLPAVHDPDQRHRLPVSVHRSCCRRT